MTAAVHHLSGTRPAVWHNDHSRPESPRIRRLEEEIARVVRARVVNPKWIRGVMRHGYKGAFEMAATVDYLFAFAATARAVGDHHFDAVFEAYVEESRTCAPSSTRTTRPPFARSRSGSGEAVERGLWRPPLELRTTWSSASSRDGEGPDRGLQIGPRPRPRPPPPPGPGRARAGRMPDRGEPSRVERLRRLEALATCRARPLPPAPGCVSPSRQRLGERDIPGRGEVGRSTVGASRAPRGLPEPEHHRFGARLDRGPAPGPGGRDPRPRSRAPTASSSRRSPTKTGPRRRAMSCSSPGRRARSRAKTGTTSPNASRCWARSPPACTHTCGSGIARTASSASPGISRPPSEAGPAGVRGGARPASRTRSRRCSPEPPLSSSGGSCASGHRPTGSI